MLGRTVSSSDVVNFKTVTSVGKVFEEDDLSAFIGLSSESEIEERLCLPYTQKRHTELIDGLHIETHAWRMKERMKTVSVALVLCLNLGVDPPDVVKTHPCARWECWIDPMGTSQHKALELIGAALQSQYEKWQPRARYKQSLDPTVEDVRKLCISLRRNAKDERVLFHYNGHGVPRPTTNGEIWVFNKTYTQYIPLSIYDLQMWMGSPSIYVYDCSNAGIIVDFFRQFCQQRERETQQVENDARHHEHSHVTTPSGNSGGSDDEPVMAVPSMKNCIHLVACAANELLPMNPELPADLFTACLTTPLKMALRWYVLQNTGKLVMKVNLDMVERIPGQLNDRRTMLGELNWIFTAITDTIAWNILPGDLFQRLFRQDLLVASLFRNFLLAERIMRSYNCTPMSNPKLPPTYQHPLWQAWDLTLDLCLSQLPGILNNNEQFQFTLFFAEQLTAFQVWLTMGSPLRSPPEQLPVVLQVLLSQVHRLRALELLGRFLDLGPWAVSLALLVGIFPYVLKLLQSSARELRPLLVLIWAKIMVVDNSCQMDLIKDGSHKYFLLVLTDSYLPAEYRTMAAFVLAMIVNNCQPSQEAALQANLISSCLEQLSEPKATPLLKQWLALCLGKIWTNYDAARWCGVRDSAHEKLYCLLDNPVPEVRAAAVFALGTFINNSTGRNEHANTIDHGVAMNLVSIAGDGSPLVRKELLVALAGMVQQFESQFISVARQFGDEERDSGSVSPYLPTMPALPDTKIQPDRRLSEVGVQMHLLTSNGSQSDMKRSSSSRSLRGMIPSGAAAAQPRAMDGYSSRMGKTISSASLLGSSLAAGNVYVGVWKTIVMLSQDPYTEVADMAKTLVTYVRGKTTLQAVPLSVKRVADPSSVHSAPNSPIGTPGANMMHLQERESSRGEPGGMRESASGVIRTQTLQLPTTPTQQVSPNNSRSRKLTNKSDEDGSVTSKSGFPKIQTMFFEWCCKYFAQPMKHAAEDTESAAHYEHKYRCLQASHIQADASVELRKTKYARLDCQAFLNRNPEGFVVAIRFHPFERRLFTADKDNIGVWDWEDGNRLLYFSDKHPKQCRIAAIELINTHDRAMLLTATDDGSVRVWRNVSMDDEKRPELVSAWLAVPDVGPASRGTGVVLEWEQKASLLYAGGESRLIRIWDAQREMKIQDLPSGADGCVTSLSCDPMGKSLLLAGCSDGSVRLFDRRLPPSDCIVQTMREHNNWVLKAYFDQNNLDRFITGSVTGDIRYWDRRSCEASVRTSNVGHSVSCLDIHPYANLIACGSSQQLISVLNSNGEVLSSIKYHEGFMGQRIGQVVALNFHPHMARLAASGTDSYISIYASDHRLTNVKKA